MTADAIRVLLVDDEAAFRDTVSRRLEKRGMKVIQASGGAQCLEIMSADSPEVVVSDVKMPGMDGLELLQRLKEDHPDTEVILLTGHASTADGVSGIKAGAFDYLTKPVEFEHLLNKVRQAYDQVRRRKEKREELEFKEKMAQQMIVTERLAALGTLATGVAHEINNPLALIKESAGWMEMIVQKETNMPRKEHLLKALGKIEKGVERARRITHQLLGFVQKNDSAISPVNLSELLEETMRLTAREALNKGVEVTKELSGREDVIIYSDPYQLRQVLLNLISNAVYAAPQEGRVALRLAGMENSVRIDIEDDGEGIPSENLEKIFEPFFTTKAPGKGTGLGLFVSKGIVQRLGGKLSVVSRVGRGTVFTVTLPRNVEIPAPDSPENKERNSVMDKIKSWLE